MVSSSSVESLRNGGEGIASTLPSSSSSDHSRLFLAISPPRHGVRMCNCSKLCAVCFVAGVVVGYWLRGRVNRWLCALLRSLLDD